MEPVKRVTSEFNFRVFEESYSRIEKCLKLLTKEQIWDTPNSNITSVGCLVKHLLGNAQQWVYAGVLEHPFHRDRNSEFNTSPEMSAEDLIFEMQAVKSKIVPAMEGMTEQDLERKLVIQGFSTTGFSAIIHVIEHFSYHTGQISLLTKFFQNVDLGYYSDHKLDV